MTTQPKEFSKKHISPAHYWQQLIESSSSQHKLWLENLEIPMDDKDHHEYRMCSIKLNKNTRDSIDEFLKKEKLPIMTFVHGALGILINRFSSTDDVIYGTASIDFVKQKKNSHMLNANDAIVPFKAVINKDQTILSYLNDIKLSLNHHKKYEKSYIKSTKNIKMDFSYLLVLSGNDSKKNLTKSLDMINPEITPLILHVQNTCPLTFSLIYNKAKFSQASIQNLINHYLVILDEMVRDPDQLSTHFSILTPKEKKLLLHEWNNPYIDKTALLNMRSIHDLFIDQARIQPNHPAIVHNNTIVTYKELDDLSNQIAHFLLNNQISSGDSVVVMMDRTPSILAVMLGVFKVGAIYIPINPKYPDERIHFIIDDCGAKIILSDNSREVPPDYKDRTILIDNDYAVLKNMPAQSTAATDNLMDKTGYVIYTSGTTGQPKGVMITHRGIANLIAWYKTHFNVTSNDRASQFASQGFDTYFCETLPYLALGASIHIVDDNEKLTPSIFLPWLVKHRITICDLPTAYGLILFTLTWPENLALKLVKIGGESVTHYPSQTFPFDIWNGYGPTETTVEATFLKFYQANVAPEDQPCKHFPPPIGKPIINMEAYVVDHHMQLVPIGCVGELLIGGPGVSPGYLNRKQLTREKFIYNPFSQNKKSTLYRTGDLVRWLDDGNLEFIGRIDHQVKIRGFRIELSEIEMAIRQYPDISEAVVIAKEQVNGQKSLIAYLVPDLNKMRIPYQERCMIALDETRYIQAFVDDISKEGMAINGLSEQISIHSPLKINCRFPGSNEEKWLTGTIVWQTQERAGILFDKTLQQNEFMENCIQYYLSSHNLMETIQSASAKRNIRKALKNKIPDYMIPSVFSILPNFPLTFNGKIDWKALPPPQDFDRMLERNYVDPRNKTEKEVAKIWCDILGLNKVSMTDSFFDLGGNSLLVSQLSIQILQKFTISIPVKIFFDLPFVPVIAEYIDSNGKKLTYKSAIQESIQRDAILNDDIVPLKKLTQSIPQPQHILLTGAGGFLGIYLLRELLLRTEAKIYCLIRKSGFESIAKRFIANIEYYGLTSDITLSNRRIVLISADIAQDQFGIPSEQYLNLAEKVDIIFHCGAQVNTMASYTNLRNSNVQGTIEVIKFATHTVDKSIHYISTLSSACMKDEDGNYSEVFPNADSSQLVGGYALSKWVSERLLAQVKDRGLPVSIYRSGYILGDSRTGMSNLNDALLLLIKGCIQMGYAPEWKEKITILPVDFVSKCTVRIALYQCEKSGVFHIDHPTGIMWMDLIAWLNDYGFNIKICAHALWLELLSTIDKQNALYPFLPLYLSQAEAPNTPDTSVEQASKILKNIDLPYPEINDDFLSLYVDHLCEVGFLPAPLGDESKMKV